MLCNVVLVSAIQQCKLAITIDISNGLPWWLSYLVKNLPSRQEIQVWPLDWEDPLEKGKATHSSILAWRILWTEEPSGLQSMGSQRVRHNWATYPFIFRGFPGGSDNNESACSTGDPGSIPELRRSPGEGNGNPLQYSCLEKSVDRGAWWTTVHGVTKSWTQLSD